MKNILVPINKKKKKPTEENENTCTKLLGYLIFFSFLCLLMLSMVSKSIIIILRFF